MAEEKKQFTVLYDYSDVPTLRRFALCNDRIRLVIGPFGSGKSSACVIEIISRAHQQKPGPDGIRRSRWAVVRNSYVALWTNLLASGPMFRKLTSADEGIAQNCASNWRRQFKKISPPLAFKIPFSIQTVIYYGELKKRKKILFH